MFIFSIKFLYREIFKLCMGYFIGGVSPPVLPCLQYWFSEKFCQDIHNIDIPSIDNEEFKLPPFFRYPENRQSLGELLVGFFKYYVTFK